MATKADIRDLQRDLNRFTNRYLAKVARLQVDGDRGHATNRRIQTAKFYLGYTGKSQRSSRLTKQFRQRLDRPKDPRFAPKAMRERAEDRRREQRRRADDQPAQGVAIYEGRPVAAWLVPYLAWAKSNGWKGTLVSGYRTPEYSESLCLNMCGAPSCPGRCAGRASNHAGNVKPAGAVDVSDYVRFGELMARAPFQPKIFNGLDERDPVHFSVSGR